MKKTFESFNELDPYNEEDWNDEKKHIPNTPGVCPNCGSESLEYGQLRSLGGMVPQVGYEYDCLGCNYAGIEIYDIIFYGHEER